MLRFFSSSDVCFVGTHIAQCKIVNEILIVFQKNFRKCGKSLFCGYRNSKKTTCINKTARKLNIRERQNSRPQKSA